MYYFLTQKNSIPASFQIRPSFVECVLKKLKIFSLYRIEIFITGYATTYCLN